MRKFTCDLCEADIGQEPHGFKVDLLPGVSVYVNGPVTLDKEQQVQLGLMKYVDWCHKCVRRALRGVLEQEEMP